MTGRRASDRHAWPATVSGFVVFGAALWLHHEGAWSEWATLALMFLGGVLVRGESVLGLFRRLRR